MDFANQRVQSLPHDQSAYQILNALLNSLANQDDPYFIQTREVIIQDIMNSTDLQALSEDYDNLFLVPMRAKSWRFHTGLEYRSGSHVKDASSLRIDEFEKLVKERYNKTLFFNRRDGGRCFFTSHR